MGGVLGLVGQRLRMRPRASQCVDSEDPNARHQFFASTLDFAILPYSGGHPYAGALRCDTKAGVWKWAVQQVLESMTDPA